jgi:hypothetical protein
MEENMEEKHYFETCAPKRNNILFYVVQEGNDFHKRFFHRGIVFIFIKGILLRFLGGNYKNSNEESCVDCLPMRPT